MVRLSRAFWQHAPAVFPPDAYDEATREAIENVQSIERVPDAILPRGPARGALIALAQGGEDVFAYASGGEAIGTWCIWWDALARGRADRNGRVPITEWCRDWQQLLIIGNRERARQASQNGGAA